ncbi:MAG: methylated-DNA--[protein]-cysteine S-methyltransferase [Clostridiales bacterium]
MMKRRSAAKNPGSAAKSSGSAAKNSAGNTGFFRQVYGIVDKIPAGKVATYGQIAALIGHPLAAKMVGFAMSQAPAGLPCHRVVNRLGEMAPRDVFGSPAFQQKLLEDEGIVFLPNGRIDLKKCLWDPPTPAGDCTSSGCDFP